MTSCTTLCNGFLHRHHCVEIGGVKKVLILCRGARCGNMRIASTDTVRSREHAFKVAASATFSAQGSAATYQVEHAPNHLNYHRHSLFLFPEPQWLPFVVPGCCLISADRLSATKKRHLPTDVCARSTLANVRVSLPAAPK